MNFFYNLLAFYSLFYCVESTKNVSDELAIQNLREYLRIPSVQPEVNYDECVQFLQKQANDIGLPVRVIETEPKKPIVLITWKGKRSDLPSIVLNSHMDVVPAVEENWKFKPFAADMDENGNIYARGSQDMKSVGMQYLEAIKRLKSKGVILERTVHVTFVPDEEVESTGGMKKFVKMQEFKELNVGVLLDEGMPLPISQMPLFYDERYRWAIWIHCNGTGGHGSWLFDNTPGEKVTYILDQVYKFRKDEVKKYKKAGITELGKLTSINLTGMKGGVASNVIPTQISLNFDIRISITTNLAKFENMLDKWCKKAGEGVYIEFEQKAVQRNVTLNFNENNIYWKAFKEATDSLNVTLIPMVNPAVSDSRFIRELGIPAFGFSPMNNTKTLLHTDNEYLNKDVFITGINIFEKIITNLGNLN